MTRNTQRFYKDYIQLCDAWMLGVPFSLRYATDCRLETQKEFTGFGGVGSIITAVCKADNFVTYINHRDLSNHGEATSCPEIE